MQAHVKRVLDDFVARLDPASQGGSILLYGSAARNEHVPGRSDLNLLVIVSDLSLERLGPIGRAFAPLEGHSPTPPLLFSEAEWARAGDVFPIEIADMQVARVVLAGNDPIAGLEVERANLRRALERELRGKLLRLRQGYAIHAENDRELTQVGLRSSATLAALVRAGLVLAGEPAPIETPAMLRRAGAVLGFDPAPAIAYFGLRTEPEQSLGRTAFERYLAATEVAVRLIDQFHVGGH